MTQTPMTPEQEHAFYADPANQVPHGLPVRRKAKLSEPVPVRFPQDLLAEIRAPGRPPTTARSRTGFDAP